MIPRFRLDIPSSSTKDISKVLRSGILASGPITSKFEAAFAKFIGTKHAVALANGTAALHLALLAVGVKPRAEVIMPSFTYHAAAAAVMHCNARPVLVDVEPRTMCIDPERITKAVTRRTRAIIATHFTGHPCDMKRIHEVAEDTRLPVIEDAAHAAGATYRDGKVGSFGRAGCFSFYPTKPLTTGEGGMITTEEDEVARKARSLRSLSTERTQGLNYDVRSLGFTYRMSELQAALGLHQLDALDHTNSLMRTKASVFKRRLKGVRGLILPYEAPYVKHVYNLFVVRVMPREFGKDRDEVSSALLRKGIATQLHYIPIHRLTFFSRIAKFKKATLKVSESLGKTVLSLPLYPRIRADELDRVVSALLSCRNGS